MFEPQKEMATKTFYAAIGAPVVVGRRAKEAGSKIGGFGSKVAEGAHSRFDAYADEGERIAKRLQDRKVMEEIQNRVDFEKVQERVEQLRDQLETAMGTWRENFGPAQAEDASAAPESDDAPETAGKPEGTNSSVPSSEAEEQPAQA